MRYINNKKYRINYSCEPDITYYVKFQNRRFFLMKNDSYIFEIPFKNIFVIYCDSFHRYESKVHGPVVLLLVNEDSNTIIYDLLYGKSVDMGLHFKSIRLVYSESIIVYSDPDEITFKYALEKVYEIIDKSKNMYNYSLEEGLVLGPIKDSDYCTCEFGYEIKSNIIHYYSGKEYNLDNYELMPSNQHTIYKSKHNDIYYLFDYNLGMCRMDDYLTEDFGDDTWVYFHIYPTHCDYTLEVKYNLKSHKIEERRLNDASYNDYDLLSDGFGGDEEAMSACFVD